MCVSPVGQVGEIKAHAAEWKANVRAEFRETRRRLSVEVHDKLQRAAAIRSMERRQLGLDQRAQSLDVLSPEKRAAFNSLDGDRYTGSSQESIDSKLNNLRMRVEQYDKAEQASSEDNLFNRFGSVGRLGKRDPKKNKDLKKNIAFGCSPTTDEEKKDEEDHGEKEFNTSLTDLPQYAESSRPQSGFFPIQTKERACQRMVEEKGLQTQMSP